MARLCEPITYTEQMKELLPWALPRGLETFHMFENRTMRELHRQYMPADVLDDISTTMWRVCLMFPKLEHFSACSIIDASDFFCHFTKGFAELQPWPELRTLCLTSKDLVPKSLSEQVFIMSNERRAWELLIKMTKVAEIMPKLEAFELLAELWVKYAKELLDREFSAEVLVLPELLLAQKAPGERRYYPHDIVQHLELVDMILHPTSLEQMRCESRGRTYTDKFLDVPRPVLEDDEKESDPWSDSNIASYLSGVQGGPAW